MNPSELSGVAHGYQSAESEAFYQLVMSRRSLRRYRDEAVPRDCIVRLLDAAIRAPSAHNRQPWRFAVVQQADTRQRLALAMGARLRHDLEADAVPEAVIAADVARSYNRITSAPLLIVVCLTMQDMDTYSDARRNQHELTMAQQSVAMAGQNLLLAAHAEGLAGCWMCAPLFCQDVVRHTLELADEWQPQGMVTLGYPAQQREKSRHPLEVVTRWLD